MSKSFLITAQEIAEELGVSESMAYKWIRRWNDELEKQGYMTMAGRVSRQYYHEKIYGLEKEEG